MISPWTPSKEAFQELLTSLPPYRLEQLWQGLYKHNTLPSEISNLPKVVRENLSTQFSPALREVVKNESDAGTTIKWLWELHDKKTIETVLMQYKNRTTVCVSSQAGCAMGCGFCATGQAGYERNLTVGEILEQLVAARKASEQFIGETGPKRLSNIVFMGMGEPFANYNVLLESIHRIINDFEIGARKITVSTIGLIPQIKRFSEENLQVGLAVSLHAANDTLRDSLIPINKRHPIDELIRACQYYREKTNRRVSFEWAMIEDTNDSDADAKELVRVARAAQAHVNLIPLNPTPGWPTVGSSPERIKKFVTILQQSGIQATVRKNRGVDINAACGQLKASQENSTKVTLTSKVKK